MLFALLVSIVAIVIDARIWGYSDDIGLFEAVTSLALFIPQFSVTCRRLHDIDKSGWWQFVPMVPLLLLMPIFVWPDFGPLLGALAVLGGIGALVLMVILIFWLCRQSDLGPNRFGENLHTVPQLEPFGS